MSIDVDLDANFDIINDFIESAEDNSDGFVRFKSDHAIYVEYPTEYDDKKPPFEPLRQWVKRNINTDDVDATTYKIQNYIYKHGTEGIFFLNRTKSEFENSRAEQIIESYDGRIEDAPKQIMEQILKEILENSKEIIEEEGKVDTSELIESGVYVLESDSDLVE